MRWLVLVFGLSLVACSSSGQGNAHGTAASDADDDSPAQRVVQQTVADDEQLTTTTSPGRLEPLDCSENALEIVETLLLLRQRQDPVDDCAEGLTDLINSTPDEFPCWRQCADGTTFVSFQLNPVVVEGEVLDPDTVQFTPSRGVLYVAVYRTDDGELLEAAESIRLLVDDDGTLGASDVSFTDLTARREGAEAVLDQYFAALLDEDWLTAADLLGGAGSAGWDERSDLTLLLQDGFVEEPTLSALADGLRQWCETGALCRAPDRIEFDITPTYGIRGIAQFDTDAGIVESEFLGTSFEGIAEVRGLPPLP